MKWIKHGLIIKPNKELWWMQSHAMVPTPVQVEGSIFKIYFSGRNSGNQSHIGFAVLDLTDPSKILKLSREPVLTPGSLGCFDDNGVTPSSVVVNGDQIYLYYIGWNPGSTVRMHLFGGLAISCDGGESFERYSEAPIIERCKSNPFLNTAPFVIKEKEGWKMYYVAGVEWVNKDLPRYNIQLATSSDGLNWKRDGHVCIDFLEGENALARPYVIHEDGIYKMWFASKKEVYKIKYAESIDGIVWKRRDDKIGISSSSTGFDSDMIEYGAVVTYNNRKYMFYNGNDYGRYGICFAVEEKE